MRLSDALQGQRLKIVKVREECALHAKVQAMGLHSAREATVLSRSGRMMLVEVGNVRLALSDEIAGYVEVHPQL